MGNSNNHKRYISIIVPAYAPSSEGEEIATIPGRGGVDLHSKTLKRITEKISIDWEKFREDWNAIRDQVSMMMDDMSEMKFGKLDLSELEVQLSVSGEGSIGIVTTGATASIILKFKEKS